MQRLEAAGHTGLRIGAHLHVRGRAGLLVHRPRLRGQRRRRRLQVAAHLLQRRLRRQVRHRPRQRDRRDDLLRMRGWASLLRDHSGGDRHLSVQQPDRPTLHVQQRAGRTGSARGRRVRDVQQRLRRDAHVQLRRRSGVQHHPEPERLLRGGHLPDTCARQRLRERDERMHYGELRLPQRYGQRELRLFRRQVRVHARHVPRPHRSSTRSMRRHAAVRRLVR